jgi:hypothetical protein
MKTNQLPEDDDPLRQVLHQWKVETPLPPRFQEEVWRRITRVEAKPERTFLAGLLSLLDVSLARPKVAYSYLIILLLLGVVGGSWAAQREANRLDAALGSRYVQSVDPYQKVAFNP